MRSAANSQKCGSETSENMIEADYGDTRLRLERTKSDLSERGSRKCTDKLPLLKSKVEQEVDSAVALHRGFEQAPHAGLIGDVCRNRI